MNHLAKARIVIDLTEQEKICPNCGSQMKKVRTETSERLVHIPAREYIEVVVRNVYEYPNCVTEDDKPVTKASKEKRIIERSIATPSLLAHVFMGKYQRHTPFYCQEDCYNYQGLHIDMHPKKVTVLKVTGVDLVTLLYFLVSCNTAYLFYCNRLSDRSVFFCFKTVTVFYNCKYSDFCQSFMTIRYVPFGFCSRNCTGDNPPRDCFGLSLL